MLQNSLSYFFLSRLIISKRSSSLIRRITVLSFAAITISVALFFIVLFVMNGMNYNIRSRILALDPHLSVYLTKEQVREQNISKKPLIVSNSKFEALETDQYDLILRTIDGQFRGASVIGYKSDGLDFWLQQLSELKKKSHAQNQTVFIDYDDLDQLNLGAQEIAIGVDLARSLGILEGDVVTLIPAESLLLSSIETPQFEKVTVRKILTTDLHDLDSKLVFFNKDLSMKSFLSSVTRTSGYHLWLKDISKMNSIQKELQKSGFVQTETWEQKNSDLFFALFLEKTMIGIFLGLAGLIASSSILTVLALILSQKKSDIAIIKTLGFSNEKTLKLFMTMGLWISMSGLFLGTIIGVSLSYYIQNNPLNVLPPQLYYDASIPALVSPWLVFYVIVIVSVLAIIGCYIPARASLKIEPAILLKSKH
ncbi:MAG: FtsX-like permease family protein [Pseudobdellovibrio sp.]